MYLDFGTASSPVVYDGRVFVLHDNDGKSFTAAIDAATGALVTQGSREGAQPAVSPNTGRLHTVGQLEAGPFSDASFDIHVITDAGFAALTSAGARASRWVEVDLQTGRARRVGLIGGGEAVRGVALEPW